MADGPQTDQPSDDEAEGTDFNALVDAPVTALVLSSSERRLLSRRLASRPSAIWR